jgi:hypothetical protein
MLQTSVRLELSCEAMDGSWPAEAAGEPGADMAGNG